MKRLAFLLAIIIVLSVALVGCGKKSAGDVAESTAAAATGAATPTTTMPTTAATTVAPTPGVEEEIIGEWVATADFTDVIVESLGDMEGVEEYAKFEGLNIKVFVLFDEDGTGEIIIDEDTLVSSEESFADQIIEGLDAYCQAELGVGAELAMLLQGTTLEAYRAELLSSMELETIVNSVRLEGTYMVIDNEITLYSNSKETVFEFDDGTLRVVETSYIDGVDTDVIDIIKSAQFKKS